MIRQDLGVHQMLDKKITIKESPVVSSRRPSDRLCAPPKA
jgi:hypothetical protein